jgi:succinate dehydrogenase / fumarate reductase cytochrome b subunit
LLLLVYWITAIASGPAAYARAALFLSHPLFRVLFALGLLAFAYHLCNGIRHLCWDVGLGLERREARRSAWIVVAATLLIAGIGWVVFFGAGAASWAE